MIFVDSSNIISQFLEKDPNHTKAAEVWTKIKTGKIITDDILKESLTVISQRKGRLAATVAYQKLITENTLIPVSEARFQAGLKLFLDPQLQKDVSLIDCITAAVCHELKIRKILSFDPHFRAFGLKIIP